jgi:ferredoxin
MALHFDPTDDHPSVPYRRASAGQTLLEAQLRHGICSASACQWPIAGWCVSCGSKLCLDHLQEHRNQHARAYARAELEALEASHD